MQPQSPVVPKSSPDSLSIRSSTRPNRKYGDTDNTEHSSPASHGRAGDAHASRSQSPTEHSATQFANGLSRASPVERNRIDEYEKSTGRPQRRDKGPTFEVVASGKSGTRASLIHELPTEILIHALAHLSPSDLASIALVSKRFHGLVTSQHAWQAAFTRYFPGPGYVNSLNTSDSDDEAEDTAPTRREFTRLTSLASWRSEYIIRTRLLKSLARGKPVQAIPSPATIRAGQSHTASPSVLYNSNIFSTINHIHSSWGADQAHGAARIVHGASDLGLASASDPTSGRIDVWGLSDPTSLQGQFADVSAEAPYGLGTGQVVGVPHMMDISEPFGRVCAEGVPGGRVFFRFSTEARGHRLVRSINLKAPELGIPIISAARETPCCLWIAKTPAILSMTDGIMGILVGSSLGVVSAYSTEPTPHEQRHSRGELTMKWVLSPGVPIIAISVDEHYSVKRQASKRIWAVVLNALGEVFYLSKVPTQVDQSPRDEPGMEPDEAREIKAWTSGRSVRWDMVESTRRRARPDPYGESVVDGSYSPRGSWNGLYLSAEQIRAETTEVQRYLDKKPMDFQKMCRGWDMRRRLEVDYGGDDLNDAGEAVVVIDTGLDEDTVASVTRFTRHHVSSETEVDVLPSVASETPVDANNRSSLFGGSHKEDPSGDITSPSQDQPNDAQLKASSSEDWRSTQFSLNGQKSFQITASALDQSTIANLTSTEDPILSFSGSSTSSSPYLTPLTFENSSSIKEIPGHRARLLALGTSTGTIVIFNARAPSSATCSITNTITPLRIIYTDSPAISTLALSSLYLVAGGTDGLVQAWDPLASSHQPIRTLHSRFSTRARRRLVQAAASPAGVGINLYAAGAVSLDPDATVLRGAVGLGTHIFAWHFSSGSADAYRSHKRRLRRSERLSNSASGEKYVPTPRGTGGVKRFIENEQAELQREAAWERREEERLRGRFGTGLLGEGASEDEVVAYAALLSREAYERDSERRVGEKDGRSALIADSRTQEMVHNEGSSGAAVDMSASFDADMAEAIRLSLAADGSSVDNSGLPTGSGAGEGYTDRFDYGALDGGEAFAGAGISVKYAKPRRKNGRTPTSTPRSKDGSPAVMSSPALTEVDGTVGHSGRMTTTATTREEEDVEFALMVSLAEERSRAEIQGREMNGEDGRSGRGWEMGQGGEGWSGAGKGKGRAM